MARDPSARPILRGLLLGAGATVFLVVLATVWLVTRPTEARMCVGGAPIDDVGGATAEEARARWAGQLDLGIDVDHPDELDGSDDREEAVYVLGPPHAPADSNRTHVKEIVVELGDDDVWRVTEAPTCAIWTE